MNCERQLQLEQEDKLSQQSRYTTTSQISEMEERIRQLQQQLENDRLGKFNEDNQKLKSRNYYFRNALMSYQGDVSLMKKVAKMIKIEELWNRDKCISLANENKRLNQLIEQYFKQFL